MDIITKIKQLNLPLNEVIVVGSAILSVKGIRESNDIDLLVSESVFNELKKRGWKSKIVDHGKNPKEMLSDDLFEAGKEFWQGETVADFMSNPDMTEMVDGVLFMSLKELVRIKKIWKRENDLKDLILIENYLKTHE